MKNIYFAAIDDKGRAQYVQYVDVQGYPCGACTVPVEVNMTTIMRGGATASALKFHIPVEYNSYAGGMRSTLCGRRVTSHATRESLRSIPDNLACLVCKRRE